MNVAANELVHKNEKKYFWLVLTISIFTYILLSISIIGIFIALFIACMSLFVTALMIGHIRMNAVKLSEHQFPQVYERTKALCAKMDISYVPDVYVMESSGMLNAFATRFFGKNMVVLYSEIFELIEREADDELDFVIAHELAHIKRKHLSKLLVLLPAMWIPGLAELYLRACEYTCDRYAAYYTEKPEAGANGLTIFAIGKSLYKHVDRQAYLQQVEQEKGFFVWLSEILSTHPPLPKRIREIELFFSEEKGFTVEKKSVGKAWVMGAGAVLVLGAVVFGAYSLIDRFSFQEMLESAEESFSLMDEPPPMIDAVVKGDRNAVTALIENGEDLNVEDTQGFTPLHWAVQDGNDEMVQLLLEAGADSNYEDYSGMTPLMIAAEYASTETVERLIEAGADSNYQDFSGMSAIFYAVYSDNIDTVQLLIDHGADLEMVDIDSQTALMHAIQFGNRDIVEMLKKSSQK